MELLIKPERWLCLPTAFAMALGMAVEQFLLEVGHRGAFPAWDKPEPACRVGVHIQECIRVALNHGYAVTPFEVYPTLLAPVKIDPANPQLPGGAPYVVPIADRWTQFKAQIMGSIGVIVGLAGMTGWAHAVAYDHGTIFDPDGDVYEYDADTCLQRHFYTQCVWRVDRIIDDR